MSGSSLKSAAELLRGKFAAVHVDAALEHFSAAIEKFVSGDWEATSQKAGKFVEAITKSLMLHCGKKIENPRRFRVQTQLAHQASAAAKWTVERKMSARLSYRVAIRRKSLRRQNMRSMTLRCL